MVPPQVDLTRSGGSTSKIYRDLLGAVAHGPQGSMQALRQENAELRTHLGRTQRQLDEANARIETLTREVGRLADLVAQGNDRLVELLAVAQRKQRARTSRGPSEDSPAPPPPVELGGDAKARFDDRPMPPTPPEKAPKPHKPPRPTGRKPVPEHLEPDVHRRTPDACGRCGSDALDPVDEVVETKLHVVQEHQRRRVVHRKTVCCRACGERTTARSLPAPFSRSKATCEWLAWLLHQHFVLLVPLDRIRRDLVSRGIKVAMSYLVTQLERAADILGPVDGEHWKQLLAGEWMATDATGLKVLVPKLPGSHNGYLEAYQNGRQVVLQYEPHKGSDALVSKLSGFKGILVADAEHRHNALFENGDIIEAGCNAHGRRKLQAAETSQPVLAKEAGGFISAMYVAEEEARRNGLTDDALRKWRQEKIPPIKEKLRAWMDAVEPGLTPNDELAKVIRYYRAHWQALFRFVDHPQIPIDNSATEREFQNVAKFRYNRLFAGSTEGAHRMATLLGIVATCRALGIDANAYLAWAFTRLGTHRDVYGLTAADVTPAAYKAALAASK